MGELCGFSSSTGFVPTREVPAPYSSSTLQNGGYSQANTKSLWGVLHPLGCNCSWICNRLEHKRCLISQLILFALFIISLLCSGKRFQIHNSLFPEGTKKFLKFKYKFFFITWYHLTHPAAIKHYHFSPQDRAVCWGDRLRHIQSCLDSTSMLPHSSPEAIHQLPALHADHVTLVEPCAHQPIRGSFKQEHLLISLITLVLHTCN